VLFQVRILKLQQPRLNVFLWSHKPQDPSALPQDDVLLVILSGETACRLGLFSFVILNGATACVLGAFPSKNLLSSKPGATILLGI
jgi:hypothetical protein